MSTERNDGGPAFPGKPPMARIDEGGRVELLGGDGMSLRDWFAGQALTGQCAASLLDGKEATAVERAKRMYQMADAMLAEREKAQP